MSENIIERAVKNIEPMRQLATLKTAQARQRKAEAEAEAAEARVKRVRAVAEPAQGRTPQPDKRKRTCSTYSKAVGKRICDRLSDGQSLRTAAAAEGVPPSTVMSWVKGNKAFGEDYKAARETGYALLADDLVEAVNHAHEVAGDPECGVQRVAACRLEVDTKKWLLAKMLPKVYGDRTQMEISGPDGESFLPKHTLEEDERFARLMAATAAKIAAKEAEQRAAAPPAEDAEE